MKRIISVLAVILFLITAGMVNAEEKTNENNPIVMNEVVVTGTRSEQEAAKIPATVTVITADEIKKSGAQSVPDILRNLGGVSVRDLNGNGNNQVVDIGGFGDTADRHVAVVINGRRINPIDQSGVRWSLIPVDNIKRIEILYGSGAVLYGDDAMGGVINIITKDITKGVSLDAEALAGNLGTEAAHGILNYNKGKYGIQIGADGTKTDGYRERSESRRRSVYGKVQVYPTDNIMLSLNMNLGKSYYQLPGALTEAQMDANRRQSVNPADDGEDKDRFIGVGGEIDFGKMGVLTFRLNNRDEDINSDMVSWLSYVMIDSQTNGAHLQYVLGRGLYNHGNRLTLGMDYYNTDYTAFRGAFKGATTDSFDDRKETSGYYIQDEFNIDHSLILNAGARYEAPKIDLGANVANVLTSYTFNEPETAWQLGLSDIFKPGSKVYARVYKAFRYPVVDEFTSLFTGAINTNLKQETSIGYEVGTRFTLPAKIVVTARIYRMDLKNEIAWDSLTNENENLDKTRHQGGEADFRYQACTYAAVYGSIGYTDSKFRQGIYSGKQIPLVPEWKYDLGVDMKYRRFNARVQYNYVGERYFGVDYANTQKQMASYQTVDLYLSYQIKKAKFFMNATNIFNKDYSDYGYYNSWGPNFYNYYPMPEATYWAGVDFSL